MRAPLPVLLLVALAACGERGAPPAPDRAPQPDPARVDPQAAGLNVVLLLSDDHDWEHFGFLGHPADPTPELDALAARGVVFETAQATPRCRPTLAGLLSGRHEHQTGVYANASRLALQGPNLLPRLLQRAGYRTYAEGKFWEGDPRAMGFQNGPRPDGGEPGLRTEGFVRADQRELFDFLGEPSERPFFVWWAPKLPHTPHDPPPELRARFEGVEVAVPDWIEPAQRAAFVAAERTNLAMAAWMDRGLGELLERLAQVGALESTLLVFLADNGWANGHLSKGSPYEKGVRTPLVLAGPGLPRGLRRAELVSHLDVLPTILDYAGLEAPPRCEGRSLRPLLESPTPPPWRSALFGACYPKQASPEHRPERDLFALWAREARWKYVLWTRDLTAAQDEEFGIQHLFLAAPERRRGGEELYDLEADPYERADLAGDPAHAERLARLRESAAAWWRGTGGRPLPE